MWKIFDTFRTKNVNGKYVVYASSTQDNSGDELASKYYRHLSFCVAAGLAGGICYLNLRRYKRRREEATRKNLNERQRL